MSYWSTIKTLSFLLLGLGLTSSLQAQQDSLFKQRLQKLPNTLNLSYTPETGKQIQALLKSKAQAENLLGKADYYFPLIDSILTKEHLPLELRYYAMAMSHLEFRYFDTLDGARGIWHFNYATAKLYDLQISSYVDERLMVERSTLAFVKAMKAYQKLYKSWPLSLAAFSSSATKLNKALRYHNNEGNYYALRADLPERASACLDRLYAMQYLYRYGKEHGLKKQAFVPAKAVTCIKLKQWVSLNDLAYKTKTPLASLEFLNQAYKRNIIPETKDSLLLCLPANLKDSLAYIRNMVYVPYAASYFEEEPAAAPASKTEKKVHVVKDGETLLAIAAQYEVEVSEIKEWNELESDDIQIGQELEIQVTATKPKAQPKPKPSPKSDYRIYTVKSGDTLGGIAAKNRCSISDLRKWNNIKGDRINIGQKLKIYK